MIKNISKVVVSLSLVALVAGCSSKEEPQPQDQLSADFQCKQENVLAPNWTCIPDVPGYYAGVGVAEKSAAGIAHMRRVAMMNGRSDLAQQIQTQVKDKIEGFTRATGNGSAETVDKVSTAVTKQVAKVDLQGSKAVNMWQAPSGALYMLVTVPASEVNKEVKNAVKTSFKNDEALWQQFQAKQALEQLDAEFPTE
ncbi:LPP20 family lipoprotein [Sulfurimonas sp.]|uniref:LPP20 family lipoprotein n=1 Tax=Sulfurimonas sp. TaxID=2022749 RepID=UPI003D149EF3